MIENRWMRAFVAVTDKNWFDFLRARPEIDEVNFWRPRGSGDFKAIVPGELFLFKLHAPLNFIVGGGFFQHSPRLPVDTAWDFFREKNGAASLFEMRRQIERYRGAAEDRHANYDIGCILLVSPFFFDEAEWIPVPEDWAPNIVQGKTYDLRSGLGQRLWDDVRVWLQGSLIMDEPVEQPSLYGTPTLVTPRLGQGTFRALVTDTYERRCAVTSEKVLDAAHIRPVSEGGRHLVENGLLLRSDIHRLYDRGYVTVTPDQRFLVSRRLKDDFENGEPYVPFHGQEIWVPSRAEQRPLREFLEWHADTVFRG